jgi:hypothetical protein
MVAADYSLQKTSLTPVGILEMTSRSGATFEIELDLEKLNAKKVIHGSSVATC